MDIVSARVVSLLYLVLGYDPPSVLYFLWPPKKSPALLMSRDLALHEAGECIDSPGIWPGDFVPFTPWAFVPSSVKVSR